MSTPAFCSQCNQMLLGPFKHDCPAFRQLERDKQRLEEEAREAERRHANYCRDREQSHERLIAEWGERVRTAEGERDEARANENRIAEQWGAVRDERDKARAELQDLKLLLDRPGEVTP